MPEFDWSKLPLSGAAHDGAMEPPLGANVSAARSAASEPEASAPVHHAAMISLHPGMQLIIEHNLHGDALDANNLCVVVGTLVRERWRDGKERTNVTPLGATQAAFQIAVQEVVGDETGASLSNYRMPLSVSTRLLASDLFATDQARVALSGPLRLERSYDHQFASDDLDVGLPVWETRLDAITVQAIADDVPDGSWVQLEGEIDGAPIIRSRPIGPGAFVPFASVRLRYCRPLRGAFARSKARYATSVIVPLEVSLDGMVEHAGALLTPGNIVRVEGRLAPYAYRRRPSDPRVAAALIHVETTLRARGGPQLERRVRAAQQRLLRVVQMAVGVGYVEVRQGNVPTDDEIARLIAERPRRVRQSGTDGRATHAEDDRTPITAVLDEATTTALSEPDAGLAAPSAATVERVRPRQRTRSQADTEPEASDAP